MYDQGAIWQVSCDGCDESGTRKALFLSFRLMKLWLCLLLTLAVPCSTRADDEADKKAAASMAEFTAARDKMDADLKSLMTAIQLAKTLTTTDVKIKIMHGLDVGLDHTLNEARILQKREKEVKAA